MPADPRDAVQMAEPPLQRPQARPTPPAPATQPPIPVDAAEAERARIARVLSRLGPEQTRTWARRTAALYRTAVLDHEHYAHTAPYRRRFIESYLELKRFAQGGADGSTRV